jgi:hypothetical protein
MNYGGVVWGFGNLYHRCGGGLNFYISMSRKPDRDVYRTPQARVVHAWETDKTEGKSVATGWAGVKRAQNKDEVEEKKAEVVITRKPKPNSSTAKKWDSRSNSWKTEGNNSSSTEQLNEHQLSSQPKPPKNIHNNKTSEYSSSKAKETSKHSIVITKQPVKVEKVQPSLDDLKKMYPADSAMDWADL